MFDDKTGDNKPILSELDSTINNEPTPQELDAGMDRFEFTNNATWASTAEEKAKVLLEEPVHTHRRQQLAAPPVEHQKPHQHHFKLELRILKRL